MRRKRNLEGRIAKIQKSLGCWDSMYLEQLELKLGKDNEEVLLQEEFLWYKKSRKNWVQFGDRNTKFFHTQTIVRRQRNRIHSLFLEREA